MNDPDSVLLLSQHGEFGGHLEHVLTLQDDIPLWRGGSGLHEGFDVEAPQRTA